MTATQSHALRFTGCPATRVAWPTASRSQAPREDGFVATVWTAIILGIVETAGALAHQRLQRRAAERQQQAAAVARLGKTAVAEPAESALGRLCKLVGGSSFSRGSPFGFWLEDMRPLSFLRLPWGFAYDTLLPAASSQNRRVAV